MGKQIVKQPDGKYCIFSSVVDNITYYNMSEEEIVEVWTEEARKSYQRQVRQIIEQLEAGGQPYFQFTQTFDDCIKTIEDVHGKAEGEEVKKMITNK